ncbi:hypothetical protein ACFT1A_24455 [Rhodococcus sp. NPDC057135]|uniref:hypothetical protein n=1 Tax=Rhodococcus sp. NPDC057135 TaxID=3346028 RepID=UPI0036306833
MVGEAARPYWKFYSLNGTGSREAVDLTASQGKTCPAEAQLEVQRVEVTPIKPFYVGLVFALVTTIVVATPTLREADARKGAPQCQARIPLPLDNFFGGCRYPLRVDSEEWAAVVREKNARRKVGETVLTISDPRVLL